jgi:hypothetical protein
LEEEGIDIQAGEGLFGLALAFAAFLLGWNF